MFYKSEYYKMSRKSERITSEFFKIMDLFNPFRILKMMIECMISNKIIIKSNNELLNKLKVINELNKIIKEKPFKNLLKLRAGWKNRTET